MFDLYEFLSQYAPVAVVAALVIGGIVWVEVRERRKHKGRR